MKHNKYHLFSWVFGCYLMVFLMACAPSNEEDFDTAAVEGTEDMTQATQEDDVVDVAEDLAGDTSGETTEPEGGLEEGLLSDKEANPENYQLYVDVVSSNEGYIVIQGLDLRETTVEDFFYNSEDLAYVFWGDVQMSITTNPYYILDQGKLGASCWFPDTQQSLAMEFEYSDQYVKVHVVIPEGEDCDWQDVLQYELIIKRVPKEGEGNVLLSKIYERDELGEIPEGLVQSATQSSQGNPEESSALDHCYELGMLPYEDDDKMIPPTGDYSIYCLPLAAVPDSTYQKQVTYMYAFDESGDLVSAVTRVYYLDEFDQTHTDYSYSRYLSTSQRTGKLFADKEYYFKDYYGYTLGKESFADRNDQNVRSAIYMSKPEMESDMLMLRENACLPEDYPEIAASQAELYSDDYSLYQDVTTAGTPLTRIDFYDESGNGTYSTTIYCYPSAQAALDKYEENESLRSRYYRYEYKDKYIIVTIPSETPKDAFLFDERYQYSKPWLTQEILEKNYDNYFMYQ